MGPLVSLYYLLVSDRRGWIRAMAFLHLLSSKPFGADPGFHLCAGEPQFGLLLPELSPCQLRCASKLSQLKGLHLGSGEAPAQPQKFLARRVCLFQPFWCNGSTPRQSPPMVLDRLTSSTRVPARWHPMLSVAGVLPVLLSGVPH